MRRIVASMLLLGALCASHGAIAWDPIGDARDPRRIARNAERAAREALKAAERAAREGVVQSLAPQFVAWLNQSRASASSGAQPIPAHIREQIGDFLPAAVLDRARYKVGDPGVFNLAQLSISYGGAYAVTLDNVIVFKSANDALTNAVLWVHELKHVQQFAAWGVHDFAIRYLRGWNSVENEAYAAQKTFQSQLERAPTAADFDGNGSLDRITLLTNTIVVRLNQSDEEKRTFINVQYNTKIGLWLVLDVNNDRCADLVHIVTSGVPQPHYAHTHVSRCDGTFAPPDKLQFNAPGVANPQGDYSTSLGYWTVKHCQGRPVLAHDPQLADGRNHFWYPQTSGPNRFAISNDC
jgi:hypothetical protein